MVDVDGLPYSGSAAPVVTGTNGTVRRTYRAGAIPGPYVVDVRTGTANLTVNIAVGSGTKAVVIPVY